MASSDLHKVMVLLGILIFMTATTRGNPTTTAGSKTDTKTEAPVKNNDMDDGSKTDTKTEAPAKNNDMDDGSKTNTKTEAPVKNNYMDDGTATTPSPVGPAVEALIRLPNEEFTEALKNPESDEYKGYKDKIERQLGDAMMKKNSDIMQVRLNSLSSGSVVANTTVQLNADVDPKEANTGELVAAAVTEVVNGNTLPFEVDGENITTRAVEATASTTDPDSTTVMASEAGGSEVTTDASEAGKDTSGGDGVTSIVEDTSGGDGVTKAAGEDSDSTGDNGVTTAASANEKTGTTSDSSGSEGSDSSGSSTNTKTGSNTDTATTGSGSDSNSPDSSNTGETESGGSSGGSSNGDSSSGGSSSGGSSSGGSSSGGSSSGGSSSGGSSSGDSSSGGSSSSGSSSDGSSSGGSSSSGSSSGSSSSGGSASVDTHAYTVLVDKTSLNGMGVLVSVTASSLPSVDPYKDKSKKEYVKFSTAASTISSTLKGTSEGSKFTGNAQLKQVVVVNTTTVRAEYLAQISENTDVGILKAAIDDLDETEVFGLNTDTVTTKVENVALAANNRWTSSTFKLSSATYDSTMSNPASDAFKKMKDAIEPSLKSQLKAKLPAVRRVYVMELRRGSVIVRTSIETDDTSTNTTTEDLSTALNTIDTIGDYNVDADTITVSSEEYIAGAQMVNGVPKEELAPTSSTTKTDNEDIKKGDITVDDDKVKFVPIKRANYFLTVTIPAFAAVLFVIIIFLCCTTSDSLVCKICSSDPKSVP